MPNPRKTVDNVSGHLGIGWQFISEMKSENTVDALVFAEGTYMKLFITALLFALIAARLTLAADSLEEIDDLLAKGRREEKACLKFKRKWKSIVKGGLNSESPAHVSKQQGLDTLKLMEKYPGHSPSFARAWKYFVEHQEELATRPDQSALHERLMQIPQACESFSHSTHLRLLLRDIDKYNFGKKERKQVVRVLRQFLSDDNLDVSLGALASKANVLHVAIEALHPDKKDALLQQSAKFLTDLEAARLALQAQQRNINAAGKKETMEFWRPELDLWKTHKESLSRIVAEAKFE